MSYKKSGAKTLLMSIIMSSPGPLVVGLGLIIGRSSTQIADFVRRSAEFLAIVMSFAVYTLTLKYRDKDDEKVRRLEKSANFAFGILIGIAGLVMTFITFALHTEDKGNIIPALAIALLSASANSVFWVKYTRLHRVGAGAIMTVQSRLYRAKTLIDAGISAVLLTILIAPQSSFSHWLDFSGSLLVAIYLTWCGIKTVYEEIRNK